MGLSEEPFYDVTHGAVVTGGEDVEPAVVIKIPRPAGKAVIRSIDSHQRCLIAETAVTVVMVQPGVAAKIIQKKVGITVVIVVNPCATLAKVSGASLQAGSRADLLERSITVVMVEAIGLLFAADEQVEPAVVVVVGPGGRIGVDRIEQAGFLGDIAEFASAFVAQQRRPDGMAKPGPARNEDVHSAVIIVVGLVADQPAKLIGDSGLLGTVVKRRIALVAVVSHWRTGVERAHHDVEQAVIVEVFHDRSAGLVETIHAGEVAHVAELANIEFRIEEARDIEPEPRIYLIWVLAERHVCEIQQPADLEIVGELAEVFREMLDCEPRAGGIGVHGRGGYRQDAGTFAAAHDAVVVFTTPQGRYTLAINHRCQHGPRQPLVATDERAEVFKYLIALFGLAFVVEQGRFQQQVGHAILIFVGGVGEAFVDIGDRAVAGTAPDLADFLESCLWLPCRQERRKDQETTRIDDREPWLVSRPQLDLGFRAIGSPRCSLADRSRDGGKGEVPDRDADGKNRSRSARDQKPENRHSSSLRTHERFSTNDRFTLAGLKGALQTSARGIDAAVKRSTWYRTVDGQTDSGAPDVRPSSGRGILAEGRLSRLQPFLIWVPMRIPTIIGLAMLATLAASAKPVAGEDAGQFDATIARLFAGRCLDCHSGPDPKGKLDLSRKRAALAGGKSGVAIIAGKPEESLLWERVSSDEMPPDSPLSETEKTAIRTWLSAGARWGSDPIDAYQVTTSRRAGRDWWSLQPIRRPAVPAVRQNDWIRTPIDRFILKELEANGLSPSPEADRRVLIRRVCFQLTGLPPAPEEIDEFLRDQAQGAYGRMLDRYLASPQYGVRWARWWLDLARFGESNGYEFDEFRPAAWRYRDWVVDSFNHDRPYNEFSRLQMAGDVLRPHDSDAIAATGFLVAGAFDTVGQTQQSDLMRAVVRSDEIEDLVGTVGQTFLGVTVNCARCHDHKFDPIRQTEYYAIASALSGVRHGERDLAAFDAVATAVRKRIEALRSAALAIDKPVRAQILAGRKKPEAALPAPDRSVELRKRAGRLEWEAHADARRWSDAHARGTEARRQRRDGQVDAAQTFAS